MPTLHTTRTPRIDVKSVLKLEETPAPEERWEGVWNFSDKDTTESFHVSARLRFAGGAMEGAGAMTYDGQHVLDATISGGVTGDDVAFAAFVQNDDTVRGVLDCTGAFGDGRSSLSGTFTHACISPGACEDNCEGGWGDFDMRRIVEPT